MKPWLAHYDADVRPSLAPYPEKTLIDYLDQLASGHAAKPALLFKGATMTYGQLGAASTAFAAALVELGVRKGDRVAVVLPNCPQFFIAEFGTWKAGAVVVALNPIYTERELEHALASTGAETVVTLTAFHSRIKGVQARTGVRRVIATSIKEYLPPALRVLFTLFKEKKDGHRVSLTAGDLWFQELLRTHHSSPRPHVSVGPDDRAVILSSGGTTGTPKGVVGLHRHYVAAGLQLSAFRRTLGTFGPDRADDQRNRVDDVPDDAHGNRGAAAGAEPDQAAQAALQRAAARRQILSEYPDLTRACLSAVEKASWQTNREGIVFRAFRIGRRGEPDVEPVAEGVSAAELHRCDV